MEGGPPILLKHNINQNKEKIGIKFNIPLDKRELRDPERVYNILAAINNPEEVKPCPKIIK